MFKIIIIVVILILIINIISLLLLLLLFSNNSVLFLASSFFYLFHLFPSRVVSCPRINIFPAESTLMFVMTVVTLHLVFINSIMRPSSASLLMSSSFMRLVWCLRLKNYFTPSLMPPREHNTSNRCKKTQLARSDEAINKKVCVTCDPGAFEAGNWKHIARTLVRQAFVINKYYFFYLLLAPLHWLLYF